MSQAGKKCNKLVGQHSYQPFYDVDYQFQFNDKDPNDIKAVKLLLMLPMIQQDKIEKIKVNHLKKMNQLAVGNDKGQLASGLKWSNVDQLL